MNYTVELEYDEAGWWVAAVRGIRGCHTQGRSIGQVMRRAREAMMVCGVEARLVDLTPEIHLPAEARRAVTAYSAERERLERQQESLRSSADHAVRVLTEQFGLSMRDAGELLGLSHQRVHQVAQGTGKN
jgi:predicted RNase H-like HicB family nuclease